MPNSKKRPLIFAILSIIFLCVDSQLLPSAKGKEPAHEVIPSEETAPSLKQVFLDSIRPTQDQVIAEMEAANEPPQAIEAVNNTINRIADLIGRYDQIINVDAADDLHLRIAFHNQLCPKISEVLRRDLTQNLPTQVQESSTSKQKPIKRSDRLLMETAEILVDLPFLVYNLCRFSPRFAPVVAEFMETHICGAEPKLSTKLTTRSRTSSSGLLDFLRLEPYLKNRLQALKAIRDNITRLRELDPPSTREESLTQEEWLINLHNNFVEELNRFLDELYQLQEMDKAGQTEKDETRWFFRNSKSRRQILIDKIRGDALAEQANWQPIRELADIVFKLRDMARKEENVQHLTDEIARIRRTLTSLGPLNLDHGDPEKKARRACLASKLKELQKRKQNAIMDQTDWSQKMIKEGLEEARMELWNYLRIAPKQSAIESLLLDEDSDESEDSSESEDTEVSPAGSSSTEQLVEPISFSQIELELEEPEEEAEP